MERLHLNDQLFRTATISAVVLLVIGLAWHPAIIVAVVLLLLTLPNWV